MHYDPHDHTILFQPVSTVRRVQLRKWHYALILSDDIGLVHKLALLREGLNIGLKDARILLETVQEAIKAGEKAAAAAGLEIVDF